MNKLLVLILVLFASLRLSSQAVEPIIDTSFTIGGVDQDYLKVVRELDNKQVLLGGDTRSIISGDLTEFNEGESDLWIVKHDTASLFGNVWDRTFGGDSVDLFADMELLPDGFIVLGSSKSPVSGEKTQDSNGGMDYWLIRCDLEGNILWDRTYGGSGEDTATTVTVLGDQGFLIGGHSNSDNDGDKSEVSRGGFDYWVLRIDLFGNIVWDKTIGGDEDDYLSDLFSYNGDYLCLGSSLSGLTMDKTMASYGLLDIWLVNLDNNGQVLGDYGYGGVSNDFGVEIEMQLTDQLMLAGSSNSSASGNKTQGSFGGYDVWLMELDSAFGIAWQTTYGGNLNDYFYDMMATPQGGLAMGGTTFSDVSGNKTSLSRGGADYWIFSVDTLGVKQWDYTYGGSLDDHFRSIYQGCDRGFLLGGFSESNESSEKLQDSKGENDYWFIRTLLPTRPLFTFSDACYGSTVDFSDKSDIWPDRWIWNFGDPLSGNNTSEDQHPQHSFSSAGDFIITLSIQEGCLQDTFFVDTITIFENKVLGTLDIGDNGSFCEGETVILDAGDQADGTTYLWTTGETSRYIEIDSIGLIGCTITNGMCSQNDFALYDWCPDVVLPEIFTPNGDGVNDVFSFYQEGVHEMELYIYNRWGEVIFYSTDIQNGWNGKDKNGEGKPVQIGVYPYVLRYRGLGTEWHVINDRHITVVR